jgi:hypothetical protein
MWHNLYSCKVGHIYVHRVCPLVHIRFQHAKVREGNDYVRVPPEDAGVSMDILYISRICAVTDAIRSVNDGTLCLHNKAISSQR